MGKKVRYGCNMHNGLLYSTLAQSVKSVSSEGNIGKNFFSVSAENFQINYICLSDTALFYITKAPAACEHTGALQNTHCSQYITI